MSELNELLSWTFSKPCPIPDDVDDLLLAGEEAIAAYKTLRDSAIFTTKRLIVRDVQGLRGKKVEVYSLPYANINMWSSENGAGLLDFSAELQLWTRSGMIKVSLLKGIDVRALDKLIAQCVLG
ncbi:MAG: PH domain-containing protein [Neisseria sp.]|nr:PH domain-containing protein [Neisseria sp.]